MSVIKSFRDKEAIRLWEGRSSKAVPPHLSRKALAKLKVMNQASSLEDLRTPPSNRLHNLSGDRAEQWSISIDMNYRICFYFEDGDAYDVEINNHYE